MDSRTSGTLRRKFSYSFSDKNSYSDIFSGTQKVSSRVEDYAEIFGGAGSSSIPVLDLSVDNNDTSESVNFRSSDLDYSNIFGGFGDEGFGVSYEELVYSAEVRGERILSGNSRTGSAMVSPSKSSDHSSFSKENQLFSSKASYLSFDDEKQFNVSYHKTGVGSKDGSNGTVHVAQCQPEPGFTCFVDDSTSQKSKASKPDSSVTSDICRKLDFSDGLLEGHHTKKAMPHPDTQKPNRRQVNSATRFNQDHFYYNDKLLNAHMINLEQNPINERLSPNVAANLENSNSFTKRSTVSNSEAPKGIASEQTTSDGSLPFFDQELDVNSDAAVSAAALGDAILKAQESIRVAKELMERKKAGLRSHPNRDMNGLKVDDRKENTTSHGGNRTRNNNVKDTCESVDSLSNVFSRMGWKGALRHGTDASDFKDSARISSLGKVISDVHSKSLDTTKECEMAPSTMSSIGKKTAAVLSYNEQSVSRSKIRQFMEKYNYDVEERTVNKETLMKQVIVEKEEEDEKAHDMVFIKGKVRAVIMETETEKNVKLARNVHEHVEMETPPISQEDEDCEKTLLELKYTDYEKMMHKTQEQDQNEQHTNSQEEHFEKRAESNKEESKCTTRNIFDVEVERFEDAIEWVENENEPRSTWGSESDGKGKKVNHMAEDVENEWGHLAIDEKRSRVHDAEESGENFRRFELKGSASDVRSSYADEKTENIEIASEEVQVLQQAHYNNSMSRESDLCIHNASDNSVESRGACQSDMIDDNYSKTKQQVDDKIRSIDKATKDFYDFKVGEAEAKDVCAELSETASLVHGAAEGSETRSNMKTIFEVLPSEERIPKFGSTEIELENTEAEQRDRDFQSNINSDIGAQVLVNRSIEKGNIFEGNKIHCEEEAGKNTHEIANGEGQHVVIMKNLETYSGPNVSSKNEKVVEVDKEIGARQNTQMKEENVPNSTAEEDEETEKMKTENDIDDHEGHPKEVVAKNGKETKKAEPKRADENVYLRKISEENKRERQREKDRIVVERAIQEARDRAFAEARERAAEVRQRVMAETRGKLEKGTTTSKTSADKASTEAKIRSERAAVERATAEARQRALEKALSQKAALRADADKSATENVSPSFRDTAMKRSDGNTTESAQRSKARLERQERIMERAAKALEEKNMRDLLVQKEESEKNRLAESLDTEIKRWSSGKEGNLRALLSTLQYILGPGSGWQPISLTDIIKTNAVKKAYRKATLYVHPDKLQQRGASIREKYICEKVFDLLKVAWNRFNSEER